MNTMSSASRRAWARSCVTRTVHSPLSRARMRRFSISSAEAGSRLDAGSSRNRTSGSRASAAAKASLCCSPADNCRAGQETCAASFACSMAARARAGIMATGPPAARSTKHTVSRADRRNSTGRWKTKPMCGARVLSGGEPAQDSEPLSGVTSPASTRRRRLFPAPFGPRITRMRGRASILMPTPATTFLPPRETISPRAIMGRTFAGPFVVAKPVLSISAIGCVIHKPRAGWARTE